MADLTFTGFSPTLGVANANVQVTTGVVSNPRDFGKDMQLTRTLRPRGGASRARALLSVLIGAAAGPTATDTAQRVAHPTNGAIGDAGLSLGGLRARETVTEINRATNATDVNQLRAAIALNRAPTTYANDLSGNGGNNTKSQLGY